MVGNIGRMYGVLPHGAAFPCGTVGLAAIRFAGCSEVVKGCRKFALLVMRKIEHVSKCSCVLFFGEDRGIILTEDRCYLGGG